MREVAVYVQYDEQVQQAIDEQFLVQCKNNQKQGLVTYGKETVITSVGKTLTQKFIAGTSGTFDKKSKVEMPSEYDTRSQGDAIDKIIVAQSKSKKNEVVSNIKNEFDKPFVWKPKDEEVDFRQQPASGWMEIIPLDARREQLKVVSLFSVGQLVSLVIRIRQSGGRDTMLSSCIAYTENGKESEAYDLTDYRGCALDLEIMPNFAVAFNSKTSVKRLETSFRMFKFPDAEKVQIKCNVLVCKKNCPVARCSYHNKAPTPQEEFINVSIIDKFLVKTAVNVVDYIPDDYEEQAETRNSGGRKSPQMPRGARYDYRLPMEPIRRPQVSTHLSGRKSDYHRSGHEVDNADYQVNDPSIPEKSSIIHSQTQHSHLNSNIVEDTSEDLLCLSPSRLIMAFGILLVILLLALTASCVLWLRARSALRRPKPAAVLTRAAQRYPHPHPGARMVPARPVFVATRTPVPYMRTVQ